MFGPRLASPGFGAPQALHPASRGKNKAAQAAALHATTSPSKLNWTKSLLRLISCLSAKDLVSTRRMCPVFRGEVVVFMPRGFQPSSDSAPEARQKLAQSVRTGSLINKSSERRRRDRSFFIGKQMQRAIALRLAYIHKCDASEEASARQASRKERAAYSGL